MEFNGGYLGLSHAELAAKRVSDELEKGSEQLSRNSVNMLRFMFDAPRFIIATGQDPYLLVHLFENFESIREGAEYDEEMDVRNAYEVIIGSRTVINADIVFEGDGSIQVTNYSQSDLDTVFELDVFETALYEKGMPYRLIQERDLENPSNWGAYFDNLNSNMAKLLNILAKDRVDENLSDAEIEFGTMFDIFDSNGYVKPEYNELSRFFEQSQQDLVVASLATKLISTSSITGGIIFPELLVQVNTQLKKLGISAISRQKLAGILYLTHPTLGPEQDDDLVMRSEGALCLQKDEYGRLFMPVPERAEMGHNEIYHLSQLPCMTGDNGCYLSGACHHVGRTDFAWAITRMGHGFGGLVNYLSHIEYSSRVEQRSTADDLEEYYRQSMGAEIGNDGGYPVPKSLPDFNKKLTGIAGDGYIIGGAISNDTLPIKRVMFVL